MGIASFIHGCLIAGDLGALENMEDLRTISRLNEGTAGEKSEDVKPDLRSMIKIEGMIKDLSVIKVDNIKKSFDGTEILHGISFKIDRGDIFGFLGPNGAGKTTTMRIVLGLLEPDSGSTTVLGEKLGDSPATRAKIGVLLENHGLYPRLSAYENLDHYARLYEIPEREERVCEMLYLVGLYERRQKKVGNFSTGMKKKLGLARALLHKPDILFLDEPTSGLDPIAQKDFRDLILTLSKEAGMTIFLNTHNLPEVQNICNKVAILDRGNIRLCDSLENLREKCRPKLDIVLETKADVGKALKLILQKHTGVEDCQVVGTEIKCTLSDRNLKLKTLTDENIEVQEFKKVEKSLEDIYMETMQNAGGTEGKVDREKNGIVEDDNKG